MKIRVRGKKRVQESQERLQRCIQALHEACKREVDLVAKLAIAGLGLLCLSASLAAVLVWHLYRGCIL